MNRRDLKPILTALAPHFPGFVVHKRTLLQTPMEGYVRAVYFDASSVKEAFYPSWVVLPLCFPQDEITLLPGERLKNEERGRYWSRDMPDLLPTLIEAVETQAIPRLTQSRNIEGFVEICREFWSNPHIPKYAAFALARAGYYEQAIATIDELIPTIRPLRDWEQEIIDKVTFLRDLIVKDPAALQEQLAEWEDLSIENLRLEAFR